MSLWQRQEIQKMLREITHRDSGHVTTKCTKITKGSLVNKRYLCVLCDLCDFYFLMVNALWTMKSIQFPDSRLAR